MRSICWARDKGNDLADQRDERRRQILVADGDILMSQAAKVDRRGRRRQRADRPTDDVTQAQVSTIGIALLRQFVDPMWIGDTQQQTT